MQTPYFHIKEDSLQYDIDLLKNALQNSWGDNYICGYSVKTNSLPWLLNHLRKQGFYGEVVSEEEYALVKNLGYSDEHIIYNGPIKDKAVFEALLHAKAIINMDSHEELFWLEEYCKAHAGETVSIGVRVNCDIAHLCPEEQLVEEEGGRFGYCYEDGHLKEVLDQIRDIPGAKVAGLHLHSSTQSRTVHVYEALASMAVAIAKEFDLDLSYIDMGGGYFGGRDDKPSYPDYFTAICRALKEHFNPEKTCLIAEPGVSLVSRATTFVTTVMDYKDIRGHRYLVTDGSRTNLNPLVTRHVYPHHFIYTSRVARRSLPSQWICGFTCMEYDRLFEITDEPELMPGDLVVYDTAGGYTMCLNPLFIKYLPAVYVEHSDGSFFQAREAWGVEEYMQKNHIED